MEYFGKVFRPPSEASSLIIQCTIGCSHNQCTFCSMYKEDTFQLRGLEDILADIEEMSRYGYVYRKVFLGDGDALILPMKSLRMILNKINELFPSLERIGIYASPKSIATKTTEELKELKNLGLGIVYLGLESGSEEILKKVKKGSSAEEILTLSKRIKDAGITLSVTLISGLGGKELSKKHATQSAAIVSKMAPDYLGLLTLMQEPGTELDREIRGGSFELLSPEEVLEETRLFISLVEGKNILFRSNHASNYLALGGNLDEDRQKLLEIIDLALGTKKGLRQEAHRAL
ncbi:MAG: radical SAM protein [Tissierellia bacterium]|nr:radical SAM protein [Tissierellia bacterium]